MERDRGEQHWRPSPPQKAPAPSSTGSIQGGKRGTKRYPFQHHHTPHVTPLTSHPSLPTPHYPLLTSNPSYYTPHIPSLTSHPSHHTPHITSLTSHPSRHTPHITPLISPLTSHCTVYSYILLQTSMYPHTSHIPPHHLTLPSHITMSPSTHPHLLNPGVLECLNEENHHLNNRNPHLVSSEELLQRHTQGNPVSVNTSSHRVVSTVTQHSMYAHTTCRFGLVSLLRS